MSQMVFTHFIFLTFFLIYYAGYACLKYFQCYLSVYNLLLLTKLFNFRWLTGNVAATTKYNYCFGELSLVNLYTIFSPLQTILFYFWST